MAMNSYLNVASGPQRKVERGPLSAEAKEEIHAFSTQVLGIAQELADRLGISRKNDICQFGE
jgi:hypothetical protein